MVSSYDVPAGKLVEKIAGELKKIDVITPPVWSKFCKTGSFKERPPINKDWWFVRAASVLQKINRLGPIGTSKLRNLYGGKGNRGVDAEKFVRASGNILRKILQQLENAGLAKQTAKGIHKGRISTPKGISLINACAGQLKNLMNPVHDSIKKQEVFNHGKG